GPTVTTASPIAYQPRFASKSASTPAPAIQGSHRFRVPMLARYRSHVTGSRQTASGAVSGQDHFAAAAAAGLPAAMFTNGTAPCPIICGSSPFHFSSALYSTYCCVIDAATVLLKYASASADSFFASASPWACATRCLASASVLRTC